MSTNPYTAENAPNGPMGAASDCVPLSAPSSDTTLASLSEPSVANGARAFIVLTEGTVSVVTLAGETRTFAGLAGVTIPTGITSVLAATTSDLLLLGK